MVLLVTTIDRERAFREFSCMNISLEAAFDFLSGLTLKGHHIVQAEVIECSNRILLPIDVFDGHLFTPAIKALEREWYHILSSPALVVENRWLTCLIQQRQERQAAYVCQLEGIIETLEQQRRRILDNPIRRLSHLYRIDRLTNSIDQYREHLIQAKANNGSASLQQLESKLSGTF